MHALPQTLDKIISKDSLAPEPYSVEVSIVHNHVQRSAIIAIKSETFDKFHKKYQTILRFPLPQQGPPTCKSIYLSLLGCLYTKGGVLIDSLYFYSSLALCATTHTKYYSHAAVQEVAADFH